LIFSLPPYSFSLFLRERSQETSNRSLSHLIHTHPHARRRQQTFSSNHPPQKHRRAWGVTILPKAPFIYSMSSTHTHRARRTNVPLCINMPKHLQSFVLQALSSPSLFHSHPLSPRTSLFLLLLLPQPNTHAALFIYILRPPSSATHRTQYLYACRDMAHCTFLSYFDFITASFHSPSPPPPPPTGAPKVCSLKPLGQT
jgi:hypothetical protein